MPLATRRGVAPGRALTTQSSPNVDQEACVTYATIAVSGESTAVSMVRGSDFATGHVRLAMPSEFAPAARCANVATPAITMSAHHAAR
jgi:hypothetical protein